jgi:hypothetical protein
MSVTLPEALLPVIPSLTALLELVESHLLKPVGAAAADHANFERRLRERTMAMEREVHAIVLGRLDEPAEGLVINEVRYRPAGKAALQVLTMAGEVSVSRTVYRARGDSDAPTVGLVDLHLRLVDGRTTLATAELLTAFLGSVTPATASSLLEQTGTLSVSKSSLDRLAKRVHDRWEPKRASFEEQVRLDELRAEVERLDIEQIVVSLDGVMVRMKDAPNTPGASKTDDGPHGHQEASSGVVALYGPNLTRLKTTGYARMPESKKGVLTEQLQGELQAAMTRYPKARVVYLADAASENWRILNELHAAARPSDSVMVNDYYHAAEHLAAGLAASGADQSMIKKWKDRLCEPGGADACVVELMRRSRMPSVKRSALRTKAVMSEVTYFNNHRDRMDYARYLTHGIPIGSGVQEAACKTYVSLRHKQSGMSWRTRGGQAILTLRALWLSGRFAYAWRRLASALQVDFQLDTSRRRLNAATLAA